ncbi:hypothetical protein Tco_0916702 [Tanacetum coccineum]
MADQDTPPPTITAIKIPIIKKEEYDIWNEATPSGEQSSPPVPKTAKQLAARRNQERIKSILLLAIPDEYLLKFHNVPDAKSLWAAIKSRFGGNEESKKMQKNVLKHQFENFVTTSNETLDKAYDRFQKLINIDEVDIDDLYNNLRVNEDELKRSSGSNSASQNLAFLSSENTKSTNEVSTAGGINQVPSTPSAHDIAYSFLAQPTTSPQLENEDLQVKKFIQMTGRNMDFKEKRPVSLDKSKIECYNCQRKRHFDRECRSGRSQGRRPYGDRSNAQITESSSQALVAQDGLGGYDWSNDFDVEPVNYALMAISSSNSSSSSDNEVQKCSKCLESFKCLQKNYDTEREKHNKAKLEIMGYEIALESLEARIIGHEKNELAWDNHDKNGLGFGTQKDDLSNKSETDSENSLTVFEVRSSDEESTLANNRFTKASTTNEASIVKPKSVNETVVSKSKINRNEVIIEDWTSDDEDDVCAVKIVSSANPNMTQAVRSQADKSGQTSQKQGIYFKKVHKIKACFVCKSIDHLIKDCDFYKSPEPRVKNVVNTRERVVKPVWDYGKKVNHQNFAKNLKYPHAKRTFNPSAVLTRACLVNTDISNVSTARSISIVRPVSTARPLALKIAQSNSVIRPYYPRLDIVRPKASNSPIKRSYFTQPVNRPKDLKPNVKTFRVNNMTIVGTRAVVSKGKVENVLKKAKWV